MPNAAAWDFFRHNIPLFDCPDKEIEQKSIISAGGPSANTSSRLQMALSSPNSCRPSAGRASTTRSVAPAGHHLHEGRWLHDPKYLDDYSLFLGFAGGSPRTYTSGAADSIWARRLVTGDDRLPMELFPDLVANYEAWERSYRDRNGLFWQIDGQDGMEVSIGGSGYRATINSYMYGDATAIARIADSLGRKDLAERFVEKLPRSSDLWGKSFGMPTLGSTRPCPAERTPDLRCPRTARFHSVVLRYPGARQVGRLAADHGSQGFLGPFGPTTAERRHSKFAVSYSGHECQWNGPSWPYSTAVTLTAMANLLNDYRQDAVSRSDYFDLLKIYARSQHRKRSDGVMTPGIDENLNPATGDWIARTTRDSRRAGFRRGKDYNHSTFCDLVITGLVGLRPRQDNTIRVNPLVPGAAWDFFCLDSVLYHGRCLTILYDRTGEHYGKGKGRPNLFVDGRLVASSPTLQGIAGSLAGPD